MVVTHYDEDCGIHRKLLFYQYLQAQLAGAALQLHACIGMAVPLRVFVFRLRVSVTPGCTLDDFVSFQTIDDTI